jgi:hypothetical protein
MTEGHDPEQIRISLVMKEGAMTLAYSLPASGERQTAYTRRVAGYSENIRIGLDPLYPRSAAVLAHRLSQRATEMELSAEEIAARLGTDTDQVRHVLETGKGMHDLIQKMAVLLRFDLLAFPSDSFLGARG